MVYLVLHPCSVGRDELPASDFFDSSNWLINAEVFISKISLYWPISKDSLEWNDCNDGIFRKRSATDFDFRSKNEILSHRLFYLQ